MDPENSMEYSVAVQSSDGQSDAVMDLLIAHCMAHSEVIETSNSGTSAVVDPNGRAHNVNRLINPNSPRQFNNQTTYNQPDPSSQNDFNFPRISQNDTLVLSDAMINEQAYSEALLSSNQALSLALLGDTLNNQVIPNHMPTTPVSEFLSEELFQELAGIDQIEPMLADFSVSNEANSYSFENSSSQSGYTPGYAGQDYNSSMVTGLGGVLDQSRPCSLALPSISGMVFSEQQAVAVRKTDFLPQTPQDSIPMEYPQFKGLEDMMLPAVVPQDPSPDVFPNQVTVQATEESKPKPGSIDENLSLIKMMNRKRPRTGPGLVAPDPLVPPSQLNPEPKTPQTPFPVQVSSPAVSEHVLSPKATETPITPLTSTKGPFAIRCYGEKELRCFELAIREDLAESGKVMALKALFYCFDMCNKFKECMAQPMDLKVAYNITAKLCSFDFDSVDHKLVSKVPCDCVPLDKFLKDNGDKIDLRGRHALIQQVLNALANIHTGGSEDKMSLWGSFLVWVDHDMNVYLLLDFPVMLAKMEQSCVMAGFDPRLEDLNAVQQMYCETFKPFISSESSWPSPGLVKLLGKRFEGILSKRSSGSRMAEVARNFGERRMCKIIVEMITIDTVVYCLEHETLQRALSPLENVIPQGISRTWEIHNMATGRVVGKEDIAIAGQPIRLQLSPCFTPQSPYKEGLLIYSRC